MKLLNIDIESLNKEDLEILVKECDLLVRKARELLLKNNDSDFSTWVNYGEKEDYRYVSYLSNELSGYLGKFDYNRREKITLDSVLESLDDDLSDEEITQEEYDNVARMLMKDNFGSVTWDW